ncbi:hypothetical protein [Microbacterium sp. GXF7504]
MGASRGDDGSGRGGGTQSPRGAQEAAPRTPPCVPSAEDLCRGNYEVAGLPDVTMEDLASFRPAAPSAASEPANVGIVGMPVNLVAAASTHTATGELFGYAVTVRFTPVGYAFDHGDGTVARTTTPGTSWAALGQAQFTPTATSHAYAARGDYSVAVATTYVAHVDFGGGWRDVPGTLTLSSDGYPLRIVEARTALVEHTCLETPSAVGC